MSLLLSLYLAQIVVQTVEGRCPEPPVLPHPIGDIFERTRLEPAGPPLRPPAARDQSGARQHLEMLGNPGEAHLERLCQLRDRGFTRGEARQDGPPGAIRAGRKSGAAVASPQRCVPSWS